jgi:hypothetical protein
MPGKWLSIQTIGLRYNVYYFRTSTRSDRMTRAMRDDQEQPNHAPSLPGRLRTAARGHPGLICRPELDRRRPRGPTQSGGQTHAGRAPLDSLNPTCAGRTHNAASKRLSDVWNLNLCARRCASLSQTSSSRHSRKPRPLPGPNCHDHARHLTHAGQPAKCLRRDLDSMVARHDEANAGSGGSGLILESIWE